MDRNLEHQTTLFHFFFSYQLGIPIPETSSGGELKPGSLPNLTNLEIGQDPGGGGGNTVNHLMNCMIGLQCFLFHCQGHGQFLNWSN